MLGYPMLPVAQGSLGKQGQEAQGCLGKQGQDAQGSLGKQGQDAQQGSFGKQGLDSRIPRTSSRWIPMARERMKYIPSPRSSSQCKCHSPGEAQGSLGKLREAQGSLGKLREAQGSLGKHGVPSTRICYFWGPKVDSGWKSKGNPRKCRNQLNVCVFWVSSGAPDSCRMHTQMNLVLFCFPSENKVLQEPQGSLKPTQGSLGKVALGKLKTYLKKAQKSLFPKQHRVPQHGEQAEHPIIFRGFRVPSTSEP